MPGIYFTKDAETGEYLACNQAFAEYVKKKDPSEVVGCKVSDFFDEENAKRFMEDDNTTISAVYTKVVLEWYDCILAIVWPLRVNYKKNVAILSQVLQKLDQ